ncbi:MAG: hypothetical protein EOP22_13765 [Hyphomicrobiales bacterium]|nr:MAG: hypothetical protein EOP22_13765 [Hyphomicrobiales bacterium]
MLIYIGSRRQTYLLRHMKPDARRPKWTGRTYAWLFRAWRLPAATYIFTGVDRLDAGERRLAARFYRHINAQGEGFRALNDPAIGMGRFRLLRTLFERGINDFNAYLATERERPSRYPVFIRSATASAAPLTGMLASLAELEGEIARLGASGHPLEDLLIIEFHGEPVREGVYRKQGAYRFGDTYLPNPSIYAATWYVKYSNTYTVPDDLPGYDREVMRDNPMAGVARQAFEIAGMEYGRADIGIVNGRPQIYEINYNPNLQTQRDVPNANAALHKLWAEHDDRVAAALRALDQPRGRSVPSLSSSELTAFRLRLWRNYAPQRY